jgi:DNA topoisomerase I
MEMASTLEPTARAAGLRYGTDTERGIRRVRVRNGFRYIDPHGHPVRDKATLARIKSLVIPPAWTDVWISPHPKSHLQATGRDARRRKQYRYHPRWRELSHQSKYSRLVPFAHALPKIRRQIARDLRARALCKQKVLAAIVQLLEKTLIRIGNEEYRRANGSFGLTTLRDRHVKIRGQAIRFEFRGKSGIKQAVTLNDARLAKIVRRCQELPGQELFQYVDEGDRRRSITSADVNNYLRQAAGEAFSAKDFRTWAGTLLAARELSARRPGASQRRTKAVVVEVIKAVAHDLRNTPAVCRACYIHPAILEAFADETLRTRLSRVHRVAGLSADEAAVLAVLESQRSWRQQLEAAASAARAKRAA